MVFRNYELDPDLARRMEEEFFHRQFEKAQDLSEIGQAFRVQRKRLGLTQTELALRAQTTQSAISQFESATRGTTLAFANRVARALGGRVAIRAAQNYDLGSSNLPPQ